jgi:hypothetical protein
VKAQLDFSALNLPVSNVLTIQFLVYVNLAVLRAGEKTTADTARIIHGYMR